MITAGEIYDYLDQIAPFETAMDFDNVGLLIGSKEHCSDKVLVALDAAPPVLREAADWGASIVVTHHPIIFNPLKNILWDSPPFLAVSLGLTVISAHTNLDIAKGGVNDTLTECIGIQEEMRFDEHCACLGALPEKMDCPALAQRLRSVLKLPGLRYTDNGKELRTVMVSCGAGGGSVFLAEKSGADAVITGEIKHHEILYAKDHGIAVFDLGHYGSEKVIVPVLTERLRQQFPGTEFMEAVADTDGIIYC